MRFSALCLTAMAFATVQATPSESHAASRSAKPAKAAKLVKKVDRAQPAADKTAPVGFDLAAPVAKGLSLSLPAHAPSSTGFASHEPDSPAALVEGAFALSPAAAFGDGRLAASDRYYEDRGPTAWRSNAFVVKSSETSVDSVRVSIGGTARNAASAPLRLVRPDADAFEVSDVDVTLTRGWPAAVKFAAGRYALDVSPHAGFGFGDAGGSAEAGATVRLGKSVEDQVSDSLGLRDGGEAFGGRGRWYVFAAASGRAVGLNMLRGQDGDWSRAGLTSDVNSKLIGDAQAGVAWRKGPMQASVGYIHREIKAKDVIMGMATQKDSMVALSFSLKPHW
jgi:hypothetical protein